MLKIISGSRCEDLSNRIHRELEWDQNLDILVNRKLDIFADGEINVEILDNIRGDDVFVVQSLSNPVNDNLIELCLILDAIKRSSVKSITVIAPYIGYSRQDKKIKSRVPISAKFVADVIQVAGIDRLLTVDLHSSQIQGFYNCPVDNLYGSVLFLDYVKYFMKKHKNISCVSPDAGGLERATYFAKKLDCSMSFCYKHRETANKIEEMRLIGDVQGKNCFIIDDMYDTCNTMINCATILRKNGAKRIEVFGTHGIFSKGVDHIIDSPIDKINVTNTIPLSSDILKSEKFNIIPIEKILAESIIRSYKGKSLSELFL